MRIKLIEHEAIKPQDVGLEWQGELKAEGHTIVAGYRIAANGVLKEFCEDITEYETVLDEDGNEIRVEIVPEVIEAND